MDIFLILLVLFLTVTAKPIQYDVQDDSLGEIQDDNGNYETQLEGDANQLDPTTSNPSTNTPELVANGDSEPFDSTQSCQPSPVQKLRKKRDVTDTMNDNTLSDSNYCRSDFFTGRPVNGENHPIRIIKKKTDNFVRMQKPTACCDLIPKQVIDGRVNWGRCIKCTYIWLSFSTESSPSPPQKNIQTKRAVKLKC